MIGDGEGKLGFGGKGLGEGGAEELSWTATSVSGIRHVKETLIAVKSIPVGVIFDKLSLE